MSNTGLSNVDWQWASHFVMVQKVEHEGEALGRIQWGATPFPASVFSRYLPHQFRKFRCDADTAFKDR